MTPEIDISKRDSAIKRGLAFIYNTACKPENFKSFGSDYLCCFDSISATARDPELRRLARTLGRERARQWRRECATVPHNAKPDDIADLVFGADAADSLGLPDDSFKQQLRKVARNFDSLDFLYFDPASEPPPTDVPEECDCGTDNPRGQKICRSCRKKLVMNSAYWVWFVALTRAYTGDRYGIRLGASFRKVLKWLPAMRPYPNPGRNGEDWNFYWAIYAVTHVVYTLNGFSSYKLSPAWLPDEFAFLKRNLSEAIKRADPEAMGEFLDSLKSFGLADNNPLIRKGSNYLLSCQNEDGSWGDPDEDDVYQRYHPTWTAIDGLRDYLWRGERLSFQRLMPLIEKTAGQTRRSP